VIDKRSGRGHPRPPRPAFAPFIYKPPWRLANTSSPKKPMAVDAPGVRAVLALWPRRQSGRIYLAQDFARSHYPKRRRVPAGLDGAAVNHSVIPRINHAG